MSIVAIQWLSMSDVRKAHMKYSEMSGRQDALIYDHADDIPKCEADDVF